jgi:hypothetical protein
MRLGEARLICVRCRIADRPEADAVAIVRGTSSVCLECLVEEWRVEQIGARE